jgi:hypothetical protein
MSNGGIIARFAEKKQISGGIPNNLREKDEYKSLYI